MDSKKYLQFNTITTLLNIINSDSEDDIDVTIANYILKNIYNVNKITIYDVSEKCYLSRSSVQRFVKKIGFNSFTEFKENISSTAIEHLPAHIEYASSKDYETTLVSNLSSMILDIITTSKKGLFSVTDLAKLIKEKNIVTFVISESSSTSARSFQESMLSTSKLIHLLSDSSTNIDSLLNLNESDLTVVLSVTGNYALSLTDLIENVKSKTVLITLNHSEKLKQVFDEIYYLSDSFTFSSDTTSRMRNVYTKYSIILFLDLLFHEYVQIK